MLVARQVFRARYGRGDELVALCWPFSPSAMIFWQSGLNSARILLGMD